MLFEIIVECKYVLFQLYYSSHSAFSDVGARGKPGLGRCAMVKNWCLDCRKGIYPCTGAFLVNELVRPHVLFVDFTD